LSCAICHVRKEKRFCPALHDRICPICCGREREVSLDCPSECIYLQQARQHEKPRPIEELAQEELFRQVNVSQQFYYDHEPLIAGLLFAAARVAFADRAVRDRDIIHGLTALAKAYETRVNSGLVYQEQTANLVHQALSAEIEKMIHEYREVEARNLGFHQLKDSDVLRALVFIIRMAHSRTNGRPRSRAFIESLLAQFPNAGNDISAPAQAGGLIIP
jgi:hypothetical protein